VYGTSVAPRTLFL